MAQTHTFVCTLLKKFDTCSKIKKHDFKKYSTTQRWMSHSDIYTVKKINRHQIFFSSVHLPNTLPVHPTLFYSVLSLLFFTVYYNYHNFYSCFIHLIFDCVSCAVVAISLWLLYVFIIFTVYSAYLMKAATIKYG